MEEADTLKELRKNSRTSISKITRGSYLKFRNCEIFIKKFVTLMDFSKLGYPIRVIFLLNTKDLTCINLRPVNNLTKLAGKYNLLIECYFKNSEGEIEYEKTLKPYKPRKHYIVNEICHEEFLTR